MQAVSILGFMLFIIGGALLILSGWMLPGALLVTAGVFIAGSSKRDPIDSFWCALILIAVLGAIARLLQLYVF